MLFVNRRDNFKLGVGLRVSKIGFGWKFMIKNVVVIDERVHLWLCFFVEDFFCDKFVSWVVIRNLLLLQSWATEGDLVEVVRLYGFRFGWKCMTKGGRQVWLPLSKERHITLWSFFCGFIYGCEYGCQTYRLHGNSFKHGASACDSTPWWLHDHGVEQLQLSIQSIIRVGSGPLTPKRLWKQASWK